MKKWLLKKSEILYHYMMVYFPTKVMYKYVSIDTQHKMWLPRFGYSKKQTEFAKKQAEELNKKIKWD